MSMELAYNMATKNTAETKNILDNVIFLLVPSLNPDGLDIVVNWYKRNLKTAYEAAPVPEIYHHYAGHDNNRDWYMFTLAETRNTIDGVYKKWHPQVLYDVHQMGNTGARLFVPPFMDPYEPNIDPILIQGASFIGQAMMNRLIGEGKTGITTNSVYDSWTPARAYQHYHGAVRILTEAASVQYASPIKQNFSDLRPGLGYDPRTVSWKFPALWRGGEWHLRDIVDYELTAAMGALEHMAYYRERWLRNFYTVQKRAISWNGALYAFVVPPDQRDPVTAVEMLNILRFGEVEVEQAEKALIIPRVVKLLIFQKELRLIFRNDPLHDERSCLVKMFDDAAHGFGIQICAVNLPRSPGRRLRHREQFRFDKSTDCRVAHTAIARGLRQA